MRGLADRRIVHVQVVADGPHDHSPGVQAHPDVDVDTVGAAHLVAVAANGVLHGERRVARPHGVVLKGDGCPKQGHDAVTHDIVHCPLIAVDGGHHAFEHGVENRARLLRVSVGQQLHGPLDVGKQHRDLLALPFEGGAGGEDLLGQIARSIAQW